MLDLDYFKEINDRFGHPAGDEVLRRFAGLLRQMVRKFDIVGRLGGEEFAVLLPETSQGMAHTMAERIRCAMEGHKFNFRDQDAVVTVSLGVAEYKQKQPLDILLRRVDNALYTAKHQGRNQVCDID